MGHSISRVCWLWIVRNFEGSIIITANICICGFQTDFILCICVRVGGNLKSFFFSILFFFYQISATISVIFFFDSRGVSGPAYAHHDYSPRPTGHPASPGAGKAPRG